MIASVERFLLGGPPPPLALLRALGLAGHAYARLPAGDPLRPRVQPDFYAGLAQHHAVRAELAGLLRAWTAAGIEALLIKGFALAEFAYPTPGQRAYGDVDMVLREHQGEAAARIARALGWRETWRASDSITPDRHEFLHLASPSGRVALDVHRRALHNVAPEHALQQFITDRVWLAAEVRAWEGARVRLPQPVDALLVGLVLGRLWSSEGWLLKAQDYLDARVLALRGGATRAALDARAAEFGCTRTLKLFLERCDPYTGRLNLTPPSRAQRLAWNIQVWPERKLLREEAQNAVGVTGDVIVDLLRELPGLLRVLRRLRGRAPVDELVRGLTPRPRRSDPPTRARERALRGVHWAMLLLRVRPEGPCLPRALTLYAALRREGYPAAFVTGVRRQGAELLSHAWVELWGEPLEDAYQTEDLSVYRENYRYPRAGEEAVERDAEEVGCADGCLP